MYCGLTALVGGECLAGAGAVVKGLETLIENPTTTDEIFMTGLANGYINNGLTIAFIGVLLVVPYEISQLRYYYKRYKHRKETEYNENKQPETSAI